ncbi:YhgE/Pip family protein [Planctomonas psychrotolerans]|uniref:YhgE/Pip family protein n=1 Tax=Planctomonas psychrotolerans TaxID=2528712 RepID=UPI0012386061|nr:YhgE/Pip domain-containing protein [Planctomonas psychrotolerans]
MRTRRNLAVAFLAAVPLVVAGVFVGALAEADSAIDRIPAAIVNDDEMVQQVLPDGTEQPVLAGRLLVTELTGDESQAFDWTITNGDEAADMLGSGEVYAVLTVPEDFSASITSLSTNDPKRAQLTIETDDAHSYLTGVITQAVAEGMVSIFGNDITAQYIGGIYSSIGDLGGSLQQAADGATALSGGAASLADGIGSLANGAGASQEGAGSLANGIDAYTRGADRLSGGLSSLDEGAEGLTQLSDGVTQYTAGVGSAREGFTALKEGLLQNPTNEPLRAALDEYEAGLAALDTAGTELSGQTSGAVDGIQDGISASASGAAQLSAGSSQLRNGSVALRDGLGELATGAAGAREGAVSLETGAAELATGLQAGAGQVPSADPDQNEAAAEIAADPIGLTVTRDNEVDDVALSVSTVVVPIGLWVGALAIFLAARPVPRRLLASAVPTGRLFGRSFGRSAAIAAVQAVLLVALLHIGVGVDWLLLPATLAFSLLVAIVFTAIHSLLSQAFGRIGLVLSLLALTVQLSATGGLYPIELVARPFQAISPYLPLTHAVAGMQSILTGGSAGTVFAAAVVLVLFGGVSLVLARLAVGRSRRAEALGLVPRVA